MLQRFQRLMHCHMNQQNMHLEIKGLLAGVDAVHDAKEYLKT